MNQLNGMSDKTYLTVIANALRKAPRENGCVAISDVLAKEISERLISIAEKMD